jgi:invasion protein IalB
MQTGKAMAVAILPMGAQQPLNIPISLKGFKSAFTSLK